MRTCRSGSAPAWWGCLHTCKVCGKDPVLLVPGRPSRGRWDCAVGVQRPVALDRAGEGWTGWSRPLHDILCRAVLGFLPQLDPH